MKRLLFVFLFLAGCSSGAPDPVVTPSPEPAPPESPPVTFPPEPPPPEPVPSPTAPVTVYVAWLPSPDITVIGYRIYYGPALDTATAMITDTQDTQDTQNSFDWQVDLGGASTMCFRITAYNADGESRPSNGVCLTI